MGSKQSEPRHVFASDMDGSRHVVVLAEHRDMSGWSIRTSRGVYPFELTNVWATGDWLNILGLGNLQRGWVAVCEHGDDFVQFVPPEG